MKARLPAMSAMLLWGGVTGAAHRLDEYLQATTISVDKDVIEAELRLTPGVAVFPIVLASIDSNSDGVISADEQRAYSERVLRDVSLTIDGDRLPLRLKSTRFASIAVLKEGLGQIQLNFVAHVLRRGPTRHLIFENHHQSRIAAYLVNCLVPRDPDIRVTEQSRNYEQSFYRLDYVQAGARTGSLFPAWWAGGTTPLGLVAVFLCMRLTWLWRQRRSGADLRWGKFAK